MDGIELMATAMRAAQTRLDLSAGNLANVSSGGFSKRVARTVLDARGLHVASALDRTPGPLQRTGRALDLAVVGDGSLWVRGADGKRTASRGGSFQLDETGRIVDSRGRALLGTRGPIVAGDGVTIDARGTIRDASGERGRIAFSGGGELRSGFLEAPNVDAIGEMIDVLQAERAFETSQKTLVALDEERQKTSDDVGRVKA